MLPALKKTMANGDVLRQLQRLLDKPETTLPAHVTAQLIFAALIELNKRVEHTNSKFEAVEDRIDKVEQDFILESRLNGERDKVRMTIPALFERLIEPVIVAVVVAFVVGALLLFVTGG